MQTAVTHNVERSRYEIEVDGRHVGVVDYHDEGGVMVITHTLIHGAMRRQGLGATLVQGVLDDARRSGRTVVPQCWFVAQFIDEHPEYADLIAA